MAAAKYTGVWLNPELRRKVDAYARERRMSVSEAVRELLRRALTEDGAAPLCEFDSSQ